MKKLVPWVAYPGSTLQNTYAEDLEHGYLVWDIDTAQRVHSVEFSQLPNPKPFVTIDWAGNVSETFDLATVWPDNARFRVRSSYALPSSDAAALGARLRKEKNASEVVFKPDDEAGTRKFASASLNVDVRSLPALERMLREYYSDETIDDATWERMLSVLSAAHPKVVSEDDLNRGTVWTLKGLEWDSLYGYGSGNTLDFEDKEGIVGIFGPNRVGKSSVVGTITYALFNSADRDAGKNAFVVNQTKKTGSARAVVSVAGSDHEVKRSTTKVVSRGLLTANTSLNVKQLDGEQQDLTGEQRGDTEKALRKLIGTYEDFALTNGQVQDDVGRFLKEGATQRKAILSRFLGIDVFEKLYGALNGELGDQRNELKVLPSREAIEAQRKKALDAIVANEADEAALATEIESHEARLEEHDLKVELVELERKKRAAENAVKRDTLLRERKEQLDFKERSVRTVRANLATEETKVVSCEGKLSAHQTQDELDAKLAKVNRAKLTVQAAQSDAKARALDLERSKRVASKLATVPCGDDYPTCPYIKDAHEERAKLRQLEAALAEATEKHSTAGAFLVSLAENELEAARRARREAERELADARKSLTEERSLLASAERDRDEARRKLNDAQTAGFSSEAYDVERYDELFKEWDKRTDDLAACEARRRDLWTDNGKRQAEVERCDEQLLARDRLEATVRTRELLVNAFSRRGIPNVVLGQLLPTLNAEMDKVLDGVVNFRVYLRADDDTNALDIMLDDGVPRPLELGSGMERFVGCLALRVALSNLTTLPKPDFMIIDEGFGSLDETNAVACVSLLRSLKRWFRFVLVVSHIDIIKDAVDLSVEVERTSEGAKVQA